MRLMAGRATLDKRGYVVTQVIDRDVGVLEPRWEPPRAARELTLGHVQVGQVWQSSGHEYADLDWEIHQTVGEFQAPKAKDPFEKKNCGGDSSSRGGCNGGSSSGCDVKLPLSNEFLYLLQDSG